LDDVLSLIKNLSAETFKGKEVSQASKIFWVYQKIPLL
jgi:hypothetical protein